MIDFLFLHGLDIYGMLKSTLFIIALYSLLIFGGALSIYIGTEELEEQQNIVYKISEIIIKHWKLIITIMILGFFLPSKQTAEIATVVYAGEKIIEIKDDNSSQINISLLEKKLEEVLENLKKENRKELEKLEKRQKYNVDKIKELEDLKNDLNKMK